jgi:hypothetical protein
MGNVRVLRENMANSISEELKKGDVLWHDSERLASTMPISLVSGKPFTGFNALILLGAQISGGYDSPCWIPHPGAQDNVAPDKKIITKDNGYGTTYGTTVEHWREIEEGGKKKLELNTLKYINIQQVHYKSLEKFENAHLIGEAKNATPDYDKADAVLMSLGVNVPKDKNVKEYHAALSTAVNEFGKTYVFDSPMLDHVIKDLKRLRTDIGTSFITLSLGMGVPEADKTLPLESWANNIKKNPIELVNAAQDANDLRKYLLNKAYNLDISQSREAQAVPAAFNVQKLSPENTGHERGWTYGVSVQEQSQGQEKSIMSVEKSCTVGSLKENQEVLLTAKEKSDISFYGIVTKIDDEKNVHITSLDDHIKCNLDPVTAERWNITNVPYEESLKCANDKVAKLKESKVISSEKDAPLLSRFSKFENGNVRLIDETAKYAVIGLCDKGSITPLVASIASLGEENMKKLSDTKGKDWTVRLEKTADKKVTVKTPKEIAAEREREKARGQEQTRA